MTERAVPRTSLRGPGPDGQGLGGAVRPQIAGRAASGAVLSGAAGPGMPR